MDQEKADALAAKLIGTQLDGWTIERLVNFGKSAAVFSARNPGAVAAVKVFDSEIVDRYGDNAQKERISRELELRGLTHPNLVAIYGGGHEESRNLYFVVMEFLDGPNLKKALPTVANEQIRGLVQQLAAAAKFLEEKGIVHRDIKPENIVLLDGGKRLVLLDLGVIRPIKGSDLTDPEGIQAFIGTLQYSSPEFLLREEAQDLEGYRALTFYQIGAVLHDLIVKRPIFEKFATPYAKLVNAVQYEVPTIINPEVDQDLITLTQKCLLKKAALRTRLIQWSHFSSSEPRAMATARERVAERLETISAQREDQNTKSRLAAANPNQIRDNVLTSLKLAARTARTLMAGMPPLSSRACKTDQNCIELVLDRAQELGFSRGLGITISVEIIDHYENVISCKGFATFPDDKGLLPDPKEHLSPWFEGVLEDVALHAAFDQFFFQATEWCLQISPGAKGNEVFFPSLPEARVDGQHLVADTGAT